MWSKRKKIKPPSPKKKEVKKRKSTKYDQFLEIYFAVTPRIRTDLLLKF